MSEIRLAPPTVGLLVRCHQFEAYVADCLRSVEEQELEGLRVVVVDDASSDGSPRIIEEWMRRFPGEASFVRLERNLGAPGATNAGLEALSGEFVSILDGDDVLAPGILARHAALLSAAPPEVAVVSGRPLRVDEALKPLPEGHPHRPRQRPGGPFEGDILVELLRHGTLLPSLGTVMRRRVLDEVGACAEGLTYCDWYLWLRIARAYRFRFSGEEVGLYRRHEGAMSASQGVVLRSDRLRILRAMRDTYSDPACREAARTRARQVARAAWLNRDPGARDALGALLEVLPDAELRWIHRLWGLPIPVAPLRWLQRAVVALRGGGGR